MYCTEPPVVTDMTAEDRELEIYGAMFGLDLDENDNSDYWDYDFFFPEDEKMELEELLKHEPKRR